MSTQIQEGEQTEDEQAEEQGESVPANQQRRMQEKRERADSEERQREEAESSLDDEDTRTLKVFRYDPEVEGKKDPRFDEFVVPYRKGMTVLDALMWARDHYDSSLTFRHSCRQAICGSDALFVNGRQRLGCKTQLSDLQNPVRIEPLPHQEVVKDLVVDMQHFYDQMDAVEPYFNDDDVPDGLEEQRQTRENREKIKMSTRCIWCGACMSSCNIAAGQNEYLGPAAINKAYRFAMDEREGEAMKQERLEILEQENGVWRCQTQFSCTEVCPKDIPLTDHIQELKREAVKNNLKFW
ncbi:succinate dehydrogenase/fumarate reductase iron-sulfur subunit [Halomarina oriensis]|uniref:Succinate dehydrogenase iron-sulfur subunit n=1 Tax=Halomarina oriensis TaxID=671145 RepID=A0A6B0GS38_9EURY|nr:succinate dehydrogenase/fumarate reductase iron-sulfur subunit [Halomarina oriensis]MWG36117.1 succinate dehydrogenase iron-sulfur subunit [Halomarina oriensis]